MFSMKKTKSTLGIFAALLIATLASSAAAALPGGILTVTYPKGLVDENNKPVDKPVLIEVHQLLSPELRLEKIEPLAKKLKEIENDAEKAKINEEIERYRNVASVIVDSNMISPGTYQASKLPFGDYEIHFISTNLANRKPVIVRLAFSKNATINVQPGPEGGVLGGGPSTAELLLLIEEQQKQIQALKEAVSRLEKK
jgi:hypothetical protein